MSISCIISVLIPPSFRGGLRIYSKLPVFLYRVCHGTQFSTIQNQDTSSRKFRFVSPSSGPLVDHGRAGELYLGHQPSPDHGPKECCRPLTSALPILGQFGAALSQFRQLLIVLPTLVLGGINSTGYQVSGIHVDLLYMYFKVPTFYKKYNL